MRLNSLLVCCAVVGPASRSVSDLSYYVVGGGPQCLGSYRFCCGCVGFGLARFVCWEFPPRTCCFVCFMHCDAPGGRGVWCRRAPHLTPARSDPCPSCTTVLVALDAEVSRCVRGAMLGRRGPPPLAVAEVAMDYRHFVDGSCSSLLCCATTPPAPRPSNVITGDL